MDFRVGYQWPGINERGRYELIRYVQTSECRKKKIRKKDFYWNTIGFSNYALP